MYLPGFLIAEDLNTTVAKVAMTLSSYFIGISAGCCTVASGSFWKESLCLLGC
jgi:hypothetical protein